MSVWDEYDNQQKQSNSTLQPKQVTKSVWDEYDSTQQQETVKLKEKDVIGDVFGGTKTPIDKIIQSGIDRLNSKSVMYGLDGATPIRTATPKDQQLVKDVFAENFANNNVLKKAPEVSDSILRVGARQGVAGIGKAEAGLVKLAGDLVGSDTLTSIADAVRQSASDYENGVVLRNKNVEGFAPHSIVQKLPNYAVGAVNSVVQMAPSLAVGGLTKIGALPALFGQTTTQEYANNREVGQSLIPALLNAGGKAGFEVAGEKLGGLDKIADALKVATKGNGIADLGTSLLTGGVKETPSELFTTAGQFAVDKLPVIGNNQDATLGDLGNQLVDTALTSMIQGGGMAAGGKVVNHFAPAPRPIEEQFNPDPVNKQSSSVAEPVANKTFADNQQSTPQDSLDIDSVLNALNKAKELVESKRVAGQETKQSEANNVTLQPDFATMGAGTNEQGNINLQGSLGANANERTGQDEQQGMGNAATALGSASNDAELVRNENTNSNDTVALAQSFEERMAKHGDMLRSWLPDFGWNTEGGKIIRDPETGEVTGRTVWTPKNEYLDYVRESLGRSYTVIQASVQKALDGKPLGKRQLEDVNAVMDLFDELTAQNSDIVTGDPAQDDLYNQLANDEAWSTFLESTASTDEILSDIAQHYQIELDANKEAGSLDYGFNPETEGTVRQGGTGTQGNVLTGIEKTVHPSAASQGQITETSEQTSIERENVATQTNQDARSLVETIAKRRAAVNLFNKSKQFDTALQLAKDFLNGEKVSPIRFANAAKAFSNDAQLSDAFTQLHTMAKVPAKQARSEAANMIEGYKKLIAGAKSLRELQQIGRDIQDETILNDAQMEALDDIVMDAQDKFEEQEDEQDDEASLELKGETPLFGRSAMKSTEENIKRGERSMNDVLINKHDVNRAMYHNELGWIDFVWGDDARGIQHIIKQRIAKDSLSVNDVHKLLTKDLVDTIASGEVIRNQEIPVSTKLVVAKGNYEAILVKNKGNNGWLLTGWKLKPSDAIKAGNDTKKATQLKADSTDNKLGAEAIIELSAIANENVKFSRNAENKSGITEKEFTDTLVQEFGNKTAQALIDNGVIVPLADQSKLPSHVVPFLRDGDIVYGFYDPKTNRTYAVLENLNAGMVRGLTLHEVGTHYGLKEMLGTVKFNNLIKRMQTLRKEGKREVLRAYKEAEENSVNKGQVEEEAIAYLVQNNPKLDLVQRIIAEIKAWLFNKFGMGTDRLTDNDIAMLAKSAVNFSARSGVTEDSEVEDSFKSLVSENSFSRSTAKDNPTSNIKDADIASNLGSLKEAGDDYNKAKSGDVKSALTITSKLITPDLIKKLADTNADFVLGVASIEQSGANAIPVTSSTVIAEKLGIKTDQNVYQSSSPKRTEMDGLDRIFNRPIFSGKVIKGAKYILVDDTITQGGTFAELNDFITENGGEVVANVALTGKAYSSKIALSDTLLNKVKSEFSDIENEFKQITGYGYQGLTESEARYIISSPRNADRFRSKISEEISERNNQRNKTPNQGNEPVNFSRTSSTNSRSKKSNFLFRRDELGHIQLNLVNKVYGKIENIIRINQITDFIVDKTMFRMANPELRKLIRHFKADMAKAMDSASNVAKTMAPMTAEDRAIVSDVVEKMVKTGVVPPDHILKIAAGMQVTMDSQTDELVKLGMLSKDSAERWRGKYLPRFYKREADPALDTFAKKMLRTALPVRGMGGGSLKGRGLYEEINVTELDQWEALGWEVRDTLWKKNQTGKLELIDPNKVRDTDKVMVWRDFTPAERESMGENRDALFRFVMGYTAMQNDIALGRMFDSIAKNQEWTRSRPSEGFTKVPDSEISDTGGVKKYGNLAGLYVRDDIIQHITQYEESGELLKFYKKALSFWKIGKTVLNPVSHMNNVVSNLTMAHFAGVSYWETHKYVGALRDFVKGSPMLDEAKDIGLMTGDITRAELLAEMPDDIKALMNMQESKITKSAKMTYNVLTFGLTKPMSKAYRFEDDFFKYLIYRDARKAGLSPDDAVDYATRYIFNYDDLPKGARIVRDTAIPFFAYTYKAVPVLAHTLFNYPWRFAAPAIAIAGLNAVMFGLAAGDGDDDLQTKLAKGKALEEQERKSLPPWLQGKSALGTEKTIRLGTDEKTGLPVYMDVSRMVPGGDIFDLNNQADGVALPAPITPSNPVLTAIAAMLWNKDTFSGKEVVDTNDTDKEKFKKRSGWLLKQISPAIAPTGYHFDKLMEATAQLKGSPIETPIVDYTGYGKDGLPVQAKYALPNVLGIKAKPIDLKTSDRIKKGQYDKEENTIYDEKDRASELLKKKAITELEYQRRIAEDNKKLAVIKEEKAVIKERISKYQ